MMACHVLCDSSSSSSSSSYYYSSKHEQLLIGHPGGGFLVLEDLTNEIAEAYQSCCHGNNSLCNLFYDVNPSDDCSRYSVQQYGKYNHNVAANILNGCYIFTKVS